jgi:hypothetical protein
MPYYESTVVKADLDITTADYDTKITDWGTKSDDEVDNLLYDVAKKARRITALPVLPMATPPESIKNASNHFVKSKYYDFSKNIELSKHHDEKARATIEDYVNRLKTDKEIYARIAR